MRVLCLESVFQTESPSGSWKEPGRSPGGGAVFNRRSFSLENFPEKTDAKKVVGKDCRKGKWACWWKIPRYREILSGENLKWQSQGESKMQRFPFPDSLYKGLDLIIRE